MSAFLNLMFFFGVFGLIVLFSASSDKDSRRTAGGAEEKKHAA